MSLAPHVTRVYNETRSLEHDALHSHRNSNLAFSLRSLWRGCSTAAPLSRATLDKMPSTLLFEPYRIHHCFTEYKRKLRLGKKPVLTYDTSHYIHIPVAAIHQPRKKNVTQRRASPPRLLALLTTSCRTCRRRSLYSTASYVAFCGSSRF